MVLDKLEKVTTKSKDISAYKVYFKRKLTLSHYCGANMPYSSKVVFNILFPQGGLYLDSDNLFLQHYSRLKKESPDIYNLTFRPGGTAACSQEENIITPIKYLATLRAPGNKKNLLPDSEDKYGISMWDIPHGKRVVLFSQLNNLYYNAGSLLFSDGKVHAYPDFEAADLLQKYPDNTEKLYEYGISKQYLCSDINIIGTKANGKNDCLVFKFNRDEPYFDEISRLEKVLRSEGYRYAISARPAFIIPLNKNKSKHLSAKYIAKHLAGSDTRHWIYHPYHKTHGPVFFSETARAVGLGRGLELWQSISNLASRRVRFELIETLRNFSTEELQLFLDYSGYKGRYKLCMDNHDHVYIEINLLKGLYNHLLLGLTASGQLVVVQTSGAVGNISGKDGVTVEELVYGLKVINRGVLSDDPIIMMFTGSQGRDVENVLVDSDSGYKLLSECIPSLRLNDLPFERGVVTTPRAAIITGR